MKTSPIPALRSPATLILAAGHGGKDSGAVNGPHNERDETIILVDMAAAILRQWLTPAAVVIAPHEHDTDETLGWINTRYGMGKAWAGRRPVVSRSSQMSFMR